MSAPRPDDVVVVGAGIAGIACAWSLTRAGVPVRVLERSGLPMGRMAGKHLEGRPVDLGAAYFTVSESDATDAAFATLVDDWRSRGLARPWTDTLSSYDPQQGWEDKPGPVRWSAPGGLSSLVIDLARDLVGAHDQGERSDGGSDVLDGDWPVRTVSPGPDGPLVDGEPVAAVALAMPDPQAARVLDPSLRAAGVVADRAWEPVIAVAMGYEHRTWGDFSAAFVNGHPDLSLIADDGSRRGDAAPVLVAHSTADRARRHLGDPASAVAPVVDAVTELLALPHAPLWTHVHRWTFARPAEARPEDFWFDEKIGLAGDGWGDPPRVQTAWRSGTLLGRAIAERLTS